MLLVTEAEYLTQERWCQMTMSKMTVPRAILMATGSGLILAGFFLFVSERRRTDVAYLDLLVCEAAFLITCAEIPLSRRSTEQFSEVIPSIGILMYYFAYSSFAFGGVGLGWVFSVQFRFQLWYQICVGFGLLVLVSMAGQASKHAGEVASEEQRKRNSLEDVKNAAIDCESSFLQLGDGWSGEYSYFERIKDDIRFLSPCDAATAVSLDLEIAWALSNLSSILSSNGQTPRPDETLPVLADHQMVQQALTKCQTLVRLRKRQRQ